jgi:hypothetical protein
MSTIAESQVFRDAVLEHFDFLVTDLDFVGPELHRFGAFYYSPEISIEIVPYDAAGNYVETFATGLVGERQLRAELSCMYIRAGLSAARPGPRPNGKPYAVPKAFARQAAALRELLPLLRGPDRDRILSQCHGR